METRRIIHGSLLVLLLWGTSLGFIGFAVAGEPTGVPDSWTLPEHLIGDRGSYTVALVEQHGDNVTVIEEATPLFDFAWLEPTIRFDMHGGAHHAFRLATQPYGVGEDKGTRYASSIYEWDSTTGETLAYTYETAGYPENGQREVHYNDGGNYWPMCGANSPLAGTTFDPRTSQVVFPDCNWHAYGAPDVAFQAKAMDVLGDVPTLYFERSDRHNEDQDMHLWLSEDHPYPLRIAVEDQREGRFYIIRLASFERGDQPMVAVPAPDGISPMEWGPFPEDIPASAPDHPFPLREAYAQSLEHEDAQELRDFVEENPDAYLSRTSFHQNRGSRQIDSWSFILCDGTARFAWGIDQEWESPTRTGLAVDEMLAENVYRFEEAETELFCPAATDLPETIPDLGWLRAFFDAAVDSEGDPGLHLWIRCGTEACSNVMVDVGYSTWYSFSDSTRSLPGNPGTSTSIWAISDLHYTIDPLRGDSVDQREMRFADCVDGCTSDDFTPAGFKAEPSSLHARVVYDTALWGFPAGVAVAGMGLLSALVGLVYLFWPTLKTGALAPLFSRIQGPAMAQHPRRRAILDLLAASPGLSMREAQRRIGGGRGSFDHHVRKLESAGMIKKVPGPGHVALFLSGASDHSTMAGSTALRSPGARALFAAAHASPGASLSDLARQAGISAATAHHHAGRLQEMGLVEARKAGGRRTLYVTARGQDARALAS